jgi:hypothetical protein
VGGANIEIVHYFGHGYLEEEKSMMHSFTFTFGAKYLTGTSLRNFSIALLNYVDSLIRPIILYNSEIWYKEDYYYIYKA